MSIPLPYPCRRCALALGLLAGAACTRPGAQSTGGGEPLPSPIAAVRLQALASHARVEGVVTVASGTMDSGFALQDGSGGIYVAADSSVRLATGARVRVEGVLVDSHGLLAIRPAALRQLGPASPPPPRPMATGAVDEVSEGLLLSVNARATGPLEDDLPYGYKLWVDDGSGALQLFLPAGGGFTQRAMRAGQTLRATGLSAQYDSTRELLLRTPADLVVTP